MSNQCSHQHRCFDCWKFYTCYNPECVPLADDTFMLCPVHSFKIWVSAQGDDEKGIVQ